MIVKSSNLLISDKVFATKFSILYKLLFIIVLVSFILLLFSVNLYNSFSIFSFTFNLIFWSSTELEFAIIRILIDSIGIIVSCSFLL